MEGCVRGGPFRPCLWRKAYLCSGKGGAIGSHEVTHNDHHAAIARCCMRPSDVYRRQIAAHYPFRLTNLKVKKQAYLTMRVVANDAVGRVLGNGC
jgi:hypothetical protein